MIRVAMIPTGKIALRSLALLGRGGYRIESDVGEEYDGGAGENAGKSVWQERMPVVAFHGVRRAENENQNGGDLYQHHHVVGAGALAHAADEDVREDDQDEQRGNIEPCAGKLAIGNDRPGNLIGQMPPENAVQDVVEIGRESYRNRHVGDRVLEDEIPTDDPGNDLAQGGIRIGVCAARNGDHGGQFGITQRGEATADRGQQE